MVVAAMLMTLHSVAMVPGCISSVSPRGAVARMGILKNVPPLLSADLLYALRSAGHGDVIAVVDANFPASSTAVDCVIDDVIQLAGADTTQALDAILEVLPLDLVRLGSSRFDDGGTAARAGGVPGLTCRGPGVRSLSKSRSG